MPTLFTFGLITVTYTRKGYLLVTTKTLLGGGLALLLAFTLAANASAADTVQDFDPPGAGTPFVSTKHEDLSGVHPSVIGPGPTGDFLRLKDTATSTINTVAFERTHIGSAGRIVADFDFRITCRGIRSGFGCADGFAFVLLNTGISGTSGPVLRLEEFGRSVQESPPAFVGQEQFAVGFITFAGSLGAPTNNFLVLTFNNGFIKANPAAGAAGLIFPLGAFDLATGINGVEGAFHHALIDLVLGGPTPNVTVTLTDAGGVSITPIWHLSLIGVVAGVPLAPFEPRLAFGARSGGNGNAVDLDNINVQYVEGECEGFCISPTVK